MYSLKLNYEVEGMNGEVFMIYKDYWPNFNDGFGGGIMVIGKRDPWEPSKEVEFDLDNTITQEWMKYPLKQVKAVCDLTVSDPTGYRDIHQLFVIDITNEWKQAQIEILD
jgi:hypothetical protein